MTAAGPGHFRNNRPARVEEERILNPGTVLWMLSPVENRKPMAGAVLSALQFDTTAVDNFRNLDLARSFLSAGFPVRNFSRVVLAAGCTMHS